jgi:hypothetical protein
MVVHNVPAMYDVARVALMSQAAYGDQRQTRRVVSAPHDNGKPVVKQGRKVPGLFVREVARLPKAVEG